MKADNFKFEVGQIVEMVQSQKDKDFKANLFRRYISDESTVQELVDLNKDKDGDLFVVRERRTKEANNVLHDLYLCENLKTQEWTLFGRGGLRESTRNVIQLINRS